MNSLPSKSENTTIKVQINCRTWSRDSHGLFDYENNQVKKDSYIISQNGRIIRNKHNVMFLSDGASLEEKDNALSQINQPESQITILGQFYFENNLISLKNEVETNLDINNQTLTNLQEKIWYVVKSNKLSHSVPYQIYTSDYKYELQKNDIIKLGRIKFSIKEINIADGIYQTTEQIFKPFRECEKIVPAEGEVCRICLFSSTSNEEDPIVSICKCKGSINLIHLNCLKLWLNQKLSTREVVNKPGISYTVKSFNCELCKEPYPTTINYKDKYYHLLNYFVPDGQNYLILESLNSIKENQYPLSLHVLMFIDEGDSFILGRGHESDVRISDISVSRSHAKISYKDKKFLLEDTGSKFGTLVLAKKPINISDKTTILQIGRTLCSIKSHTGEEILNKDDKEFKSLPSLDLNDNDSPEDIYKKFNQLSKEFSEGDEDM